MATRIASFQSSSSNTEEAVKSGLASALPSLGGQTPQFGVILASYQHPLNKVLAAAKTLLPETEFVTAWAINGFTERMGGANGIVGMLFSSDEFLHLMNFATRVSKDVQGAAKALVKDFAEWEENSKKQRLAKATTMLFIDGLSSTREQLIDNVRKGTRPYQPIVGGATTDDGKFAFCHVGTSKSGVAQDGAAAIHIFSKKNWSIGVDHGHTPTTEPMTATKSSGVQLHEIDGRPALEVYRAHAAKRDISIASEEALRTYLIQYPVGLFFYENLTRIRSPFGATPDGSLICGGTIPQGGKICILGATTAELIQAATTAAEAAKAGLDGEAAGVIVFSCFGRSQTLKNRQTEEIEAVRRVFPSVPMIGFSSYGEIARHRGDLDGFHNNTVVVVAIPA